MVNLHIECKLCKRPFVPKGQAHRALYCSPSCKQKAYEQRKRLRKVVELCAWCKDESLTVSNLYSGFCSPTCARAAESYASSGGTCRECGDLWLGHLHCRGCGAKQKVTIR